MSKSKPSNARPLPTTPPAEALRQHLSKQFTRRNRASKYIPGEYLFRLDDRNATDTWKWEVSVAVIEGVSPLLFLVLHSLPRDPGFVSLVQGLGGPIIPKGDHATFLITLRADDVRAIRHLATHLRSVVTVKWGWLTTRAAAALLRLAEHLARFSPPQLVPTDLDANRRGSDPCTSNAKRCQK